MLSYHIMIGSLGLLSRQPLFNSVPLDERPKLFAWACSTTGRPVLDTSDISSLEYISLYQVLVYPLSQEAEADNMFSICNEKMTKTYHNSHVIYSHSSLDSEGIFHSGVRLINVILRPVFQAGIVCDSHRTRTAKEDFDGVITNRKLKWHRVTPNDIFENCFDGYSLVSLTGLRQFRVTFNMGLAIEFPWISLNSVDLEYLRLAGQKYFPFLIDPDRFDRIKFKVEWEQPSPMADMDEIIYLHPGMEQEWDRKLIKYFFNNQNRNSISAVYEYKVTPTFGFSPFFASPYLKSVSKMLYWRRKYSASMIQRWWLKIYYNPYHPVGKKIIMRKFDTQMQPELPILW